MNYLDIFFDKLNHNFKDISYYWLAITSSICCNKLITTILFATSLFFYNCQYTNALQIVYPKTIHTEIYANSTFFIGNTEPNAKLTINEKDVKIYDNGSFVEVIPLKDGLNKIKIDSETEVKKESVTYTIKKVEKEQQELSAKIEVFPENQYLYASTVRNNVPLRAEPNENSKRITHLNQDIMLHIDAKQGEYYRVYLTPEYQAWVKSDNVVTYSTINGKMLSSVLDVSTLADKNYEYIKTTMSFQVPYKITETDTGLTLELYNIKENNNETKIFKPTEAINNIAINTVKADTTSTYYIELKQNLWGYDAYYEGNALILKIRKAPKINISNPLDGISIAIDAGHGGEDYGAVGPTGVKEKDINFDIAQKLSAQLTTEGARVILTRNNDDSVALYERPKIAKENDALIMVSIHANALPDGADPYEKHGTAVFYYNQEAFKLAQILKNQLIKDLNTKEDELSKSSLVLTRPTMPLSVLIEIAYMIHPLEYNLLLDESFRVKAAKSIATGIKEYLLNTINNP